MIFVDAKQEFDNRVYEWARAAARTEIGSCFPRFRWCHGSPFITSRFISDLEPGNGMILIDALLKKRHSNSSLAQSLDISLEGAGALLIQREESVRYYPSPESSSRALKIEELSSAGKFALDAN